MADKLKLYFIFLVGIFLFFLINNICFADTLNQPPIFSSSDKILILAPHPDDEAIGSSGVIQKALKQNSKVKIVCFTNGDNNELSFIVYEKRLTFKKGEFLHMGQVRAKETLAAMNYLGLNKGDVTFLGYPDFGTMEILTKYWNTSRPFRSMLARVTKVSYPEALSFGAPYVGESILKDLKNILLEFRPTKIFVSHPADTNRDHRALYLFLKVALWDLEGQIKKPEVFPYIIHVVAWPMPRGYHPNLEINPPRKIKGLSWQELNLTNEEIEKKYNTILFYKSQIKYAPSYLVTFARKNELFSDYPVTKIKNQKENILWQDLDIDKDIRDDLTPIKEEQKGIIANLKYAYHDKDLLIKINLKKTIDKTLGILINLLGYKKGIDFSQMPKINISVGLFGMTVRDKKQEILVGQYTYKGKELLIKIPFSSLGDPNYILSCVHVHRDDLSLDDMAWRILEIDQNKPE
ncbi:MAG: PIG-L family deacetylase [Candidatus Omnitrophota bacterium]